MGTEATVEHAAEAWGFKILGGGSAAGAAGIYATLDVVTVVGVAVAVCGLLLQVMESYSRRKAAKEEKRLSDEQRETDERRGLERHALEMQILRERLADLKIPQVEIQNENPD
jgi:hypothetical protein